MKTQGDNDVDFKAWRDIAPPGDFTQNVLRRIRAAPEREPRWRELLAALLASRLAFGASLALSAAIAVGAVRTAPAVRDTAALQPNSLIVAYGRLAGGE